MSVIEYKEFQSIEELRKYVNVVYNNILNNYCINRTYFWVRIKRKNDIIYSIYPYKCSAQISKSKIEYAGIGSGMIYFYVENNKVYTIIIKDEEEYQTFETKLYHLTHGPKAISIPDAFKVLLLL